jgi:hypothetical protein
MAYTPVSWEDYPSVNTPVSASNLNHMDTQIKANADDIEDIKGDITTLNNNLANCWKIAKTSGTVTLTVAANSNVALTVTNHAGISAIPLYARSSDATRTLTLINMYSSNDSFTAWFRNVGSTAYSNVPMVLEVTYAYT